MTAAKKKGGGLTHHTANTHASTSVMTPATILRKKFGFKLLHKKGEVDSIHDFNFLATDNDAINHGAENLSSGVEVCFVEASLDRFRKIVQASQCLAKLGLFTGL